MRSHQQKFLADIEAAAKEFGLELVVDAHYANNGTISISFEDRYEPIVRIGYDFQTGGGEPRATFDLAGVPEAALVNPKRAEREDGSIGRYWWLLRPQELPEIIKPIRNKMAQAVMDRQKESIGG